VHRAEWLRLTRELALRVRGADYVEVPVQAVLDELVEVVLVVVGQQDGVQGRQLVQVDVRVLEAGGRHAGAEVHVVAGVEEVGVREEPDAAPFEEGGGVAYECQGGVFVAGGGGCGVGLVADYGERRGGLLRFEEGFAVGGVEGEVADCFGFHGCGGE